MIGLIVWKRKSTLLKGKPMSWKVAKLCVLAGLLAFGFGVFLAWVLTILAS